MLLFQVEIDNDLSYEVVFSEKQPITEKNPESPTKHSIHVIFPETNDVSALYTTISIATESYAPITDLIWKLMRGITTPLKTIKAYKSNRRGQDTLKF